MSNLPVILVFATAPIQLQTAPGFDWETCELDCRWFARDDFLDEILAREKPHIIVSFGKKSEYCELQKSALETQRRWLHFEGEATKSTIQAAGMMAFARFLHNTLTFSNSFSKPSTPHLVSVFTPTFRTGKKRLQRAYHSLAQQEYSNWEWIVVDDSDDYGQTLQLLQEIAEGETRLKVFPSSSRSGRIGELKRRACALAEGEILLELDHDDELTPNAIFDVVKTFAQFPEAGFVYSDCAEVHEETGEPLTYGANLAFGYGGYREEEYSGRALQRQTLQVAQSPPINGETIRHIVSAPNHLRAWKTEDYWRAGGHNAELHVADDYELIIRTFLHTQLARIPKLCYLQYQSGHNTTDLRRSEIQRLVRHIAQFYDGQIHARLLELSLEDCAWNEEKQGASFPFMGVSGPRQTEHCTLMAELS